MEFTIQTLLLQVSFLYKHFLRQKIQIFISFWNKACLLHMWRTLLPIHALFKLHRTFMLSQEYILAGLLSLIVGKPQWHLVMWYRLSNCIAVSLCVYTIAFLFSFSSCKINLDTLHLDSFILPCCSFYSIHLVVHPLWNEQDQF